MPVRDIEVFGSGILKKKISEADPFSEQLPGLLQDLRDTMESENGLGLAANQIGVDQAVIAVNMTAIEEDPEEPVLYLINPGIVDSSGQVTDEEGCLSFPEVTIPVSRPAEISVQAKSAEGKDLRITAEGLLARVLCHEIDHLHGLTIVDRAGTVRRQMLKPVLKQIRTAGSRKAFYSE